MKKVLSMCLAVLFLAAVPVGMSAAVDVPDELIDLRRHYASVSEVSDWREVLALASQGLLSGTVSVIEPEYNQGDNRVCAQLILIALARGYYPDTYLENTPLSALLSAAQDENGRFGDAETQSLAILALDAAKVTYQSRKAVLALLSMQNEDGSFSSDAPIEDTALAISALCGYSEDTEVSRAIDLAAEFLQNAEATTSMELSEKIIGLTDAGRDPESEACGGLVTRLLNYKNPSDNSYAATLDNLQPNPEATALAMAALDAVNRSSSMYRRVADNGSLQLYSFEDFKPLLYVYLGLLAVSVAFWCYIFLKKKNTKTLAEVKQETERRIDAGASEHNETKGDEGTC